MAHGTAKVEAFVTFAALLAAVEHVIAHDEYPTLFDANVPDRLRAAAVELEKRRAAAMAAPRTCIDCGARIGECECN